MILTESWLCVKARASPSCQQARVIRWEMLSRGQVRPFTKLPDCQLSRTPLVDVMTPRSNEAQPEKEIMATQGQEF